MHSSSIIALCQRCCPPVCPFTPHSCAHRRATDAHPTHTQRAIANCSPARLSPTPERVTTYLRFALHIVGHWRHAHHESRLGDNVLMAHDRTPRLVAAMVNAPELVGWCESDRMGHSKRDRTVYCLDDPVAIYSQHKITLGAIALA